MTEVTNISAIVREAMKWPSVEADLMAEHGLKKSKKAGLRHHVLPKEILDDLTINRQYIRACYDIVVVGIIGGHERAFNARAKALKDKANNR